MRRTINILADSQIHLSRVDSALDQLAALDGARNPEDSRRELRIALDELESARKVLEPLWGRFNGQIERRAKKSQGHPSDVPA